MNIRFNKVFWTIGLFLFVLFWTLGYLIADNQPPYTYFAEQSHIIPRYTSAGHQVEVYWKLKVNRICAGTLVRSIIDKRTGARFSYDPVKVTDAVKIGDDHLARTFLLPDGISPGEKIYRVNAEYNCNPLQNFWPLKVQTPDLDFEILNLKEK